MKTEYIIIKNKNDLNHFDDLNFNNKKIFFLYPKMYDKNYSSYAFNTREKIRDNNQLYLLKKVNKIHSKLIKNISRLSIFSRANKSNLRHFSINALSAIFYTDYLVSKITPCWIYSNNKWKKFNDKKKISSILFDHILFEKKLIHFSVPKFNQGNIIHKIMISITLFLLKKKKIVVLSEFNRTFLKVAKILYKKKDIISITFVNNKKNYFLNYLSNIIKILNPFKNYFVLDFNLLMSKNNNTKTKIEKTLSDLNIEELKPFKKNLTSILSKSINYQNQITPFIDYFYRNLDIKLYISHHTRGVISPVIAEVSNNNGIKNILIPHGTLPKFGDKTFDYLINEISIGFVEDAFSSKIISQSKITEYFIKKKYPKKKFKKFQPITW
ncbi:hypothetical protein OA160_03080 [Candidatus Pelagibacter sp.]|nr:hypothetical protein [Candidatus Pelagibacter sp.]